MTGTPAAPSVTVRQMQPAEYDRWHEQSVAGYADDLAESGRCSREEAMDRARAQFAELLPEGMQTERTWLLVVLDEDGTEVGVLWIGPHPQRAGHAWVYDIAIDEEHRRRGLGRAAMRAAEQVVEQAGMAGIGLNVFGFNEPARTLYDSLGYRVVATQMFKPLD